MNVRSKTGNSFQEVQQVFTRHMRDPVINPAPADIDARRAKIYSDLIYNNIQSFLGNSFPVIRQILSDDEWHHLLRDYVKQHQSQTPLFPRMPLEFVKYLEQECQLPASYPFLPELAHYEWLETSVSLDPREIDHDQIDPNGDLLHGIPVLNQLAVPVHYNWPVHLLGPEYLPTEPPSDQTFIIVFRKPDDEVAFMVLNRVSARLIHKIIDAGDKTGQQLLTEISKELGHTDPDSVIRGGLQMMSEFRDKHVLLGTRNQKAR